MSKTTPIDFNLSSEDLDFDKNHIWHPYTSLIDPLPVYPIQSACGVRLMLQDGRELIDGMSSWWTAIHGYNHPRLNLAATQQLKKMAHVMFGGITHTPAVSLAQKLVEILPKGMDRVFFCDSGSVSVEVAMKVAIQYQKSIGQEGRTKFMTFRKGYHGDTTGAMSVCDPVSGMHHLFKDFMPEHFFADEPVNGYEKSILEREKNALIQFFEEYSSRSAAFIFEPVVQGAGGMRIYSPQYVSLVRELCSKYKVLMIADEIATGFARTGKLFAVEHAGTVPDIICLGKALTGGYVSMAAMVCTEKVSHAVCSGEAGVLMHGPTFMANPLTCAIARESLDVLIRSDWQNKIQRIEYILKRELLPLIPLDNVQDVRVLGAIGVVQVQENVNVANAQKFFVDRGVWIRPFRNLIYVMPPYVIDDDDLVVLCEAIKDAIDKKSYL